MAERERQHFDRSTVELRELAAVDRSGVLAELSHRTSRAARKLAMELQGNGDAPAPRVAEKKRPRKAKVTPQVKAMAGVTPLGIATKHRRNAQGRILSKAASAKLDAAEKAADELPAPLGSDAQEAPASRAEAEAAGAALRALGSCKPCGGRGGFAGGLDCRTCNGTGNAPAVTPRWRWGKGKEATS